MTESSERGSWDVLADRLRTPALIAVLVGGIGSVAATLQAGQSSDERLLIVLMAGWVFSPFAALVLAHITGRGWSMPTRATLYGLMIVVAVGSLAVLAVGARGSDGDPVVALFVLVPLVSWVLITVALPTAALVSRRAARRSGADSP